MNVQGGFMNEPALPCPKGGHNLLKNGFISLLPNIPTSKNNHFSEKG
jgi:hypothetical protein